MDLASLLSGSDIVTSGAVSAVNAVSSLTSFSGGMFTGPIMIASFIISTIGFSYFIYGKKNGYTMALISGLFLMVFPYFVHDITSMVGIAVFLCVLPFVIRR